MVSARYPGKNVSAVKVHNTRAVLLHLLYNEPAYRVGLAREISVSTTTVTKIVEELIEQGLVYEKMEESTGRRSVGRPQYALYLDRNARFVIGVHLGGGSHRVALVNLRGEILNHRLGFFDINTPVETVLEKTAALIQDVLAESQVDPDRILGLGVGAPGLVNHRKGVIGYAKNQGWEDAPVCRWLSERFPFPVVMENNVRAMALGEAFFGAGRDISSLLFVYGRLGVAAGIVVDRTIYRGVSLGAGEIGHTFLAQAGGPALDGFDELNTLEDLVSAPALVKKAQALARAHPDGRLAAHLKDTQVPHEVNRVFAAARAGDPQAQELVTTSARYLGLALVNAINFINPKMILLGGMFAQAQDLYLPVVQQMAYELAFAGLGKTVLVRPTSFGWKAGVVGAATLALANFFYLAPEDTDDDSQSCFSLDRARQF